MCIPGQTSVGEWMRCRCSTWAMLTAALGAFLVVLWLALHIVALLAAAGVVVAVGGVIVGGLMYGSARAASPARTWYRLPDGTLRPAAELTAGVVAAAEALTAPAHAHPHRPRWPHADPRERQAVRGH